MKNLTLIALGAATVALAAICVSQRYQLSRHAEQLTALSSENAQKAEQAHEMEVEKTRLIEAHRSMLRESDKIVSELGRQAAVARSNQPAAGSAVQSGDGKNAGAEKTGLGKLLSSMMDDPAMKKIIRDQQSVMFSQLYAPFVKKAGLTTDEADKFQSILADQAARGAEKTSALLGSTGTNRTEVIGGLAAEHRAFEDQIRQLLGDARFAQYKEYQLTAAERMQLNLFSQQSGQEGALSEGQTEQLLTYMKQEKQAVAAAGIPVPGVDREGEQMDALLSSDRGDALLQTQESVNQRVYERAKDVLSPNQLTAFARFQTNQLQMMRMGMGMARKFMAPEN